MERKHLIIEIILGIAVVLLAALAWSQSSELDRLDDALARVEARVDAVDGKGPKASPTAPAHASPAHAEVVPVRPGAAPKARGRLPGDPEREPAGTRPGFDAQDPAVRGQLREVIQEEQEVMRAERRQERQQRREQRLRQQVNDLAERAGMESDVTEQLTDLLVVEQVEAMEVFRQAREDFGWDEAREKVTALRTETDEKAKDLLDDEEYVEYQQMRQREMDRWARGPSRNREQTGSRPQGGTDENRR